MNPLRNKRARQTSGVQDAGARLRPDMGRLGRRRLSYPDRQEKVGYFVYRFLCGRPLVGQYGRTASGPPDQRERSSVWHAKTQLLVRRRAASARVDLSGRSSPRHHPKATARRAGQRRRATARRERSHAQARPLLRAGRAWRAPTRCPVRAPWHMFYQQLASTVAARCGFIACSTNC